MSFDNTSSGHSVWLPHDATVFRDSFVIAPLYYRVVKPFSPAVHTAGILTSGKQFVRNA